MNVLSAVSPIIIIHTVYMYNIITEIASSSQHSYLRKAKISFIFVFRNHNFLSCITYTYLSTSLLYFSQNGLNLSAVSDSILHFKFLIKYNPESYRQINAINLLENANYFSTKLQVRLLSKNTIVCVSSWELLWRHVLLWM